MASNSVLGYFTLMDVVNQYTSIDGFAQYIWAAEVLNRKCPLLQVLPLVASNQIMSNIAVRDSYLPSPSTRRFNEGILPTAGHTTPLTDPIMMIEDYSEVDYKLWKIQNDPNAWRQSKDKQKVEALTQTLEYGLFYGALKTNPAAINGLALRFNSLTTYPNNDSTWAYNVVDGGGTGATTTSIWLMELGEHKVYGIYPKNLPAGLAIEDLGKVSKEVGSGYLYEVLRTHFSWDIGLVIEDERCVQRYANIQASGASNIFDEQILIALKNYLPGAGEAPGTVILCNRAVKTQMDIRAVTAKMNTYFTQDNAGDVWGRAVTRFQGIPVLVAEKILSTETALT